MGDAKDGDDRGGDGMITRSGKQRKGDLRKEKEMMQQFIKRNDAFAKSQKIVRSPEKTTTGWQEERTDREKMDHNETKNENEKGDQSQEENIQKGIKNHTLGTLNGTEAKNNENDEKDAAASAALATGGTSQESGNAETPSGQEGKEQSGGDKYDGLEGSKHNQEHIEKEVSKLREELEKVREDGIRKEKENEQRTRAWQIVMEKLIEKIDEMKKAWAEEIADIKDRMNELENRVNNEINIEHKEIDQNAGREGTQQEWQNNNNGEDMKSQEEQTQGDRDQTKQSYNHYQKEMPDALGEEENEWEKKERMSRKRNIFVRGVRTVGKGIKEEVTQLVKEKMGMPIYIKRVRPIGGGLVIELESFSNKLEIMKSKAKLYKIGISVENDYTEREKEVMEWLKKMEKEERENGLKVKLGYFKAQVEGLWYEWNDREGRLIGQEEENSFRCATREAAGQGTEEDDRRQKN